MVGHYESFERVCDEQLMMNKDNYEDTSAGLSRNDWPIIWKQKAAIVSEALLTKS